MSFQEDSVGRHSVVQCCPVCWSQWPEVSEIVGTAREKVREGKKASKHHREKGRYEGRRKQQDCTIGCGLTFAPLRSNSSTMLDWFCQAAM